LKERVGPWVAERQRRNWNLVPPPPDVALSQSQPLGLAFEEKMTGFWSFTDQDPDADDDAYCEWEVKGRPVHPVDLCLTVSVRNLAAFFEDMKHVLALKGTVHFRFPDDDRIRTFETTGTMELMVGDANDPNATCAGRHQSTSA